MTHTEYTKQNVKEQVDLSQLADLPEEYMNHFSNKTILKDKHELAQLVMDQRIGHEQVMNKQKVFSLQKECLLNCDIDEGAKMIARERAKIEKLSKEMKPSMEEENKFREELQHELKQNPVFKQNIQIDQIDQKWQKRKKMIDKKIGERKVVRE